MSEWSERLRREAGVPDLVEVLTGRLAPSDLQSLLLDVYARLASKVTPAQLLQQHEQNRFVAPSPSDVRLLAEVDRAAWELLPDGYLPLELSPLCPLGTSSAIATVSQNKVVSTTRNTEAVSDSTNVLALESAARRRRQQRGKGARAPVLLAASQRVTRAQVFGGKRSWAHFRLLSLCAAGRDTGSFRFQSSQLVEQITFQARLLRELARWGRVYSSIRIAVTDFTDGRLHDALEASVLTPLSERIPDAQVHLDPRRTAGRGYYDAACFKLYARDASGEEIELGDGGTVDWTAKLLSDRKERLVISGLGVERMCSR
jgi:hypothetical protein